MNGSITFLVGDYLSSGGVAFPAVQIKYAITTDELDRFDYPTVRKIEVKEMQ